MNDLDIQIEEAQGAADAVAVWERARQAADSLPGLLAMRAAALDAEADHANEVFLLELANRLGVADLALESRSAAVVERVKWQRLAEAARQAQLALATIAAVAAPIGPQSKSVAVAERPRRIELSDALAKARAALGAAAALAAELG